MGPRSKKPKPKHATSTNRIRELRESRDPRMTAETLARLIHTTQATISRLETGERELTEDWMRRIAKALDVEPADLLETATFVNMEDEVEPYDGGIKPAVRDAIHASDLKIVRVVSNQLQLLGISRGSEVVFNTSDPVKQNAKTGDVVLVQIVRKSDGKSALVVRQFVAPALLTTNRRGRNVTMNLDEPHHDISIEGVLVKPVKPSE